MCIVLTNAPRATQETSAHPSYLSTLRQLDDIPVPDLASTLLSSATEDEANEANISFLRTNIDPQEEWQARNADITADAALQRYYPERLRDSPSNRGTRTSSDPRTYTSEGQARRERLQRVMQRLNRMNELSAYSDRVPNHNRLYDWSPASDAEDDEAELQEYVRDVRRQQPTTHPDVLRVLARHQMDADRERRDRATQRLSDSHRPPAERESRSQTETSLRSAAILQAVRRHSRFSTASRDHGRRSTAERGLLEYEYPQARQPSAQLPQYRSSEGPGPSSDSRSRARRSLLQNPLNESSQLLQRTIKYLAAIRTATTYEESFSHAIEAGFVTESFFGINEDDFLLDLTTLPSVSETSLLAPGTVFKGHQHAAADANGQLGAGTQSSSAVNAAARDPWRPGSLVSANRLNSLPPLEMFYPHRDWLSVTNTHANEWPVRVTIHSIDYTNMTLSATMVAYDVPSHPQNAAVPLNASASSAEMPRPPSHNSRSSPSSGVGNGGSPACSGHKSITTYLEGEILDFARTTLLTERFKATLHNDATYWRKLEPFAGLSDDELAGKLVSRAWMAELSRSYILMRWKERCFVRATAGGAASAAALNSDSNSSGNSSLTNSAACPVRPAARPAETADDCEFSDGCGLTISGFYYVCLRRADGEIEGLYCDPHSSPYQHLRLRREVKSAFPAWGFK